MKILVLIGETDGIPLRCHGTFDNWGKAQKYVYTYFGSRWPIREDKRGWFSETRPNLSLILHEIEVPTAKPPVPQTSKLYFLNHPDPPRNFGVSRIFTRTIVDSIEGGLSAVQMLKPGYWVHISGPDGDTFTITAQAGQTYEVYTLKPFNTTETLESILAKNGSPDVVIEAKR